MNIILKVIVIFGYNWYFKSTIHRKHHLKTMSEKNVSPNNSGFDLLIVESPAKAKAIQKYLAGMNIKVVASVGHIKELPKKSLGVELEKGFFEIELVTISGKEKIIKDIKALAKDAGKIYLGSDPDREGEAIAMHLRDEIKLKKNVFRVLFNEVTKDAIKKALVNAGQIDEKKYEAQKTRRILDRLVGYKISPLLWDKLGSGLSAGRVQSVALRLIVEREEEIKAFVPEKFFTITAKLKKDNITFESKYFGEKLDKKSELKDESIAKQIMADVFAKDFIVKNVDKKEKKQSPSAPFTTSRLQQEASNKLRFASKKTMEVAQRLYDGSISLGEKGNQGLITYMRTDSVRTEPAAIQGLRDYILATFGQAYLPTAPNTFKSKNQSAQDAHEAIRPTNLTLNPDSIRDNLSDDEYKLYSLIWNKFIASQMGQCLIDQTIVTFDVGDHFFRATGSVIKFEGFRAVYLDDEDKKKDDEESGALPKLDLEEALTPIEKPKLQEKFTQPPPRFTEATLIKFLEEKGIGRPSTYAAIITNITDRQYVLREDSKFKPSDVGNSLCFFLREHFPREMDITFTAKMEAQLDEIEEGTIAYIDVLKEFWSELAKTLGEKTKDLASIERVPGVGQKPRVQNLTGIHCKVCADGEYMIMKGKKGEFLSCNTYPACKSTQNFSKDKKGKIKLQEVEMHENPCPDCGKRLILREGKFGDFYACEGYPACKKTMPVTTEVECPDCKNGKFVKKTSIKNNSVFYGCSNYPTCKGIMNDKPLIESCLKCQHPVMGHHKEGKVVTHVCPKCKNVVEVKK